MCVVCRESTWPFESCMNGKCSSQITHKKSFYSSVWFLIFFCQKPKEKQVENKRGKREILICTDKKVIIYIYIYIYTRKYTGTRIGENTTPQWLTNENYSRCAMPSSYAWFMPSWNPSKSPTNTKESPLMPPSQLILECKNQIFWMPYFFPEWNVSVRNENKQPDS